MMVHRALAMVIGLAVFMLPACTSTRGLLGSNACLMLDDSTVRLRGEINDAMEACARETLTRDVTRVVVNTPGGETGAGRAIARQIAEVPRTLVIDGECSSSCGNYFVPAAARLEATPGSLIAIHGTPDPALMEKSRRSTSESLAADVMAGRLTEAQRQEQLAALDAQVQLTLEDEALFAAEFGVPPGWRLYRERADDSIVDAFANHFNGNPRPVRQRVIGRATLVVEPTLLESCLPRVDPGNYRTNFEATVIGDARERAAIEARNGVFSGTLICKRPEGAHSS
ncbi:MAG: hypothetical protein AAFX86_14495 [Pseudomonadota bacterium]